VRNTFLATALLLVAACGQADGPPEIAYGRDICDRCGMIISEPRWAAAYRLPDGAEYKWDDVGALLVDAQQRGELEGATVWVHDFESEVWLDAPTATYVVGAALVSPMAYGVAAFAEEERADALILAAGGKRMNWSELVELTKDGELEPQLPSHLHGGG
jgi:copper chaperone NosL